ncbi:peptidyl-prolyl cis-trans isomerase D [mine drainage metagenome]|uniref:Periplasmic chaperone PpiD n=1 Tax=mine drainage metagenome TaxID=410659 RepID=A0A1J5R0I2_9ZZZZ
MLDTFRRHSQHWIIKILFALLILSFGVWGIGDVIRLRVASQPAITVGTMEVPARAVVDDFRRQADRLITMSRGKITLEQAREMGILDTTIQQIVDRGLLDQEAARLKLAVDVGTLRAVIAADPAFQNNLHQFDKTRYETVLERAGLSERAFLADERASILRSNLFDAVGGGVAAPASAVDPLFRYVFEKRVAETITYSPNAMPAPPRPDDQVLQTYYKNHQAQFMAPELRGGTIALLRPADVSADIHPSDQDIERSYQLRQDEFHQPAKRGLQLVTLADEGKAQAFMAAVKAGKSFAAESKAAKLDVVDLGTLVKSAAPNTEIADAAFGTDQTGVVGPVQSPLGWHVVNVTSVTPGKDQPLADVRAKIVQDLVKAEAVNRMYPLSNDMEDKIGAGAAVEDAATAVGVKPIRITAIDVQGNGPDGSPLPVSLPAAVLQKMFATAKGDSTDVEKLDNDAGYYVLRVDQITPPAVRPFALIKDKVAAAWSLDQREQAARKLAEAAVAGLNKGEALQAVADAVGAGAGAGKADTTQPFRRIGAPEEPLPPTLPPAVFKLGLGAAQLVDAPDGSAIAARLKQVIPADPKAEAPLFENFRAQYAKGLGNDLLGSYRQALEQQIGVSINRSLIDQQFDK